MKVLVTGAQGMLGQYIVEVFQAAGHQIIATDREQLDITQRNQVFEKVKMFRPDLIINTAAYNFVDKLEEAENFSLGHAINAAGPGNLAAAAKAIDAPFVHYSTDYVFKGDKKEGYTEDDQPNPISKYGLTKANGEKMVQAVGGRSYICRLSKIFGQPAAGENSKESFVALMLRLAKTQPELKIVDEEVGCPSYCLDIARATLILMQGAYEPGIYHLVNEGGGVTWYDFADEFFGLLNVSTPRRRVPSSEFPVPAPRPKFAEIKNTKLPKLRTRQEALRDFLLPTGSTPTGTRP